MTETQMLLTAIFALAAVWPLWPEPSRRASEEFNLRAHHRIDGKSSEELCAMSTTRPFASGIEHKGSGYSLPMGRSIESRFADMITAIDRCLVYQPFVAVEDPTHAKMAQDAILRNLTVIGEAVRAMPAEVVSDTSGVPWRMIRALRNIVVHEYFRVDADVISRVLDNDLPSVSSLLLNLAWCQHLAKTKGHSEVWRSEFDVDGNERWYWMDSACYLSWIDDAFGESAVEREKARYLTQLEADLEELVNVPWTTAYGPESYRDPDSDYHYFNEASIELGSSERYDQLWDCYFLLWKEYNKASSTAKT